MSVLWSENFFVIIHSLLIIAQRLYSYSFSLSLSLSLSVFLFFTHTLSPYPCSSAPHTYMKYSNLDIEKTDKEQIARPRWILIMKIYSNAEEVTDLLRNSCLDRHYYTVKGSRELSMPCCYSDILGLICKTIVFLLSVRSLPKLYFTGCWMEPYLHVSTTCSFINICCAFLYTTHGWRPTHTYMHACK